MVTILLVAAGLLAFVVLGVIGVVWASDVVFHKAVEFINSIIDPKE